MSRGIRIERRGGLDHASVARLAPDGSIIAPDAEDPPPADPLSDFFRRLVSFLLAGRPRGIKARAIVAEERLCPSGRSDAALARRVRVNRSTVARISKALERRLPELAPRRRKAGAR